MNQLSSIWLLQISVLVYVALIASAAPHDSTEPPRSTNNATYAKERFLTTPEQRAEGYDIVQRLAKQFSINFFKKFVALRPPAAAFSPLSFFIPFSMLSYGARGADRNLFLSAIGLRRNETRIARFGYRRFINTLSHYNMNIDTKVYYTADLTPVPFFVALAKNDFNTDLEPVSVDDAFISAEKVNDWVKEQTNNQVADLFKAPVKIGPNASIALVSTVYFKGAWESPFNSSETTKRPFRISYEETVNVPTMHKYAKMPYGRIDAMRASFVELPLKTTRPRDPMSMFIILPDKINQQDWLVGDMDKFDWEALRNTTMRNVNLYLPKFKYVYSHVEDGGYFDYVFEPTNPLKAQTTLPNMMRPPKPISFGDNVMKFVVDINEDGDTTTGSSGMYYTKDETKSLNRNVRATGEETHVEFDANRTFMAIIATKGEVVQDIAMINFNGLGVFVPIFRATSHS